MSWFEVETKIKLRKNEVNNLRNQIKRIANFRKKEIKSDFYFAIKKKNYPIKAFRIRKTNNTYLVNFKKWFKKLWTHGVVVKEEFEFSINDKNSFLALMGDLGFVKWMSKLKISEIYYHKKDPRINIELNKVKYLGYFIEIECLVRNKTDIEKVKARILKTLKELNVNKKQIDNTGYTKMLWQKRFR